MDFGFWIGEAGGEGAAGGDADGDGGEGRAEETADDLRERDADEGAGARARDAGEESFQAHPRVDDHGHCANFEEREGGGDERQALADHLEGAVAALDAGGVEARLPRGDFGVEFGEGEGKIVDVARARATARDF